MPAYSTWQPTEGKIPPTASADQSATRRLVAPRGDPMRGNPIASTLLGIFGGPLTQSFKEPGPPEGTPWGVLVYPAQPDATICPSGPAVLFAAKPSRPHGAVVGLLTWLSNRPDQPVEPNDSSSFQENSPDEGAINRCSLHDRAAGARRTE